MVAGTLPPVHGPRPTARHASAPCAANSARPTARRERESTRAGSSGPRANVTRPTARERRERARERRARDAAHGPPGAARAVRFKGNGPWLTRPGFGRASKAGKSKIKLPLSRVKIMYRDAGPVYAGEKKTAPKGGPRGPYGPSSGEA